MNNQTNDFYSNLLGNPNGPGGDVWHNKPSSPERFNNMLANTAIVNNNFNSTNQRPIIETLNAPDTAQAADVSAASAAPAATAAKAPCGCGGDHGNCSCDKRKRAAYLVSGLLVGVVITYFLTKK